MGSEMCIRDRPILDRRALSKWGDDPEYQSYRESVPAIFPLLRARG